MLELVKYVTSSPWVWLGFMAMLAMVLTAIAGIVNIITSVWTKRRY